VNVNTRPAAENLAAGRIIFLNLQAPCQTCQPLHRHWRNPRAKDHRCHCGRVLIHHSAWRQNGTLDSLRSGSRQGCLTRDSLQALDEGNEDEAIKTLEQVTGKLELVIARQPELSMVPVAVSTKIYDVLAKIEAVEEIVEKAEEAVEDGRVQDARRLLDGLASEVVISTTHLPMATYPDAIKAVAPLIDQGKVEEAKQQLQVALNLLVVVDTVIPLPTTRANVMLDEAEQLAEQDDRSDEENQRLEELLEEIRHQVRLGRELGYFSDEKSDSIQDELESIEDETGEGKSGTGFFDKIKGFFERLDW